MYVGLSDKDLCLVFRIGQSWQEQEKNPALGKVLSGAVIRSSGERLELQLTADGETLQALLKLR